MIRRATARLLATLCNGLEDDSERACLSGYSNVQSSASPPQEGRLQQGLCDAAILPDWWDDSCGDDPSLLQDLEFRVARFLGTSFEAVSDPGTPLSPPAYQGAQLRRVRDINRDRLAAAIHVATQVASATFRDQRNLARIRPCRGTAPPGESRSDDLVLPCSSATCFATSGREASPLSPWTYFRRRRFRVWHASLRGSRRS